MSLNFVIHSECPHPPKKDQYSCSPTPTSVNTTLKLHNHFNSTFMQEQNLKIAHIRHGSELWAKYTVKFTFSSTACVFVHVRAQARTYYKPPVLGIKILITRSALSSRGSKHRPSRRCWASKYVLPFDVGRQLGRERGVREERRDTEERKESCRRMKTPHRRFERTEIGEVFGTD